MSDTQRIRMMPGERKDQYQRNFDLAVGSVAAARVSVRKIDSARPTGSARNVVTIFTNPGSRKAANSSGGTERNTTSAIHGWVTAPSAISRPGTSSSTPHPTAFINVLLIDDFARIFDGFSIGSNDLTQLTLGVDRDSELVSFDFDERDRGVLEMLRLAIEGAKRNHRHVGICGQAPSDYPEIAEFLVKLGIDSISLNPDAVVATTRRIVELEKQMRRAKRMLVAMHPYARAHALLHPPPDEIGVSHGREKAALRGD